MPWSSAFGDIQGYDAPADALKPALTQFKALYDDTFLYIAAMIHPSPELPTEVHFTQRNSPIYQRDSDFEIFVDTVGTNHNYKELEINAINTVWNLMLDKPYEDNGHEHSARVASKGSSDFYEVYEQSTSTRIISGCLNDPDVGSLWSVEMALSFSDLDAFTSVTRKSNLLRVNFSRVEKQGSINWTWQPQVRWNPENCRFSGFVNMHYPDAWGYIQLGGETIERDQWWPQRLVAMSLYYAMHGHKQHTGSYTDNLDMLIVSKDIVDPFRSQISLQLTVDGGFRVAVTLSEPDKVLSVRDDRFMIIARSTSTEVE